MRRIAPLPPRDTQSARARARLLRRRRRARAAASRLRRLRGRPRPAPSPGSVSPDESAGSLIAIDNLLVVFPCLHATSTDFVVGVSALSRRHSLGGFPILALARSGAATLSRTTDVASLAHVSVTRARDARARPDDDSSSRRDLSSSRDLRRGGRRRRRLDARARDARRIDRVDVRDVCARREVRAARVRRRSIAMRVVGLFLPMAQLRSRALDTSLASCDRPVPLARGFMAVNERPRDSDRSRGRPEASTRREAVARRRARKT